ncbi:UNVERIFIED_CONTAM: hypothetical protein PYX00_009487 [Menopon gallinae]|uniref:ATP synthase subunit n=1 Tax=Menopon gallinae TaxID=328185 RepID=A0AAW2HC04_9NEOP
MSIKLRMLNDISKLPQKAGPMLSKFWYYARVELTPPKFTDIVEIKNGFFRLREGYKTGSWKDITVKQAWLNILVAAEVGSWFYIGECIGKGSLIGYHV